MRFLDMREKLNNGIACLCLYGNDAWVKRKAIANVCDFFKVTDDGFSVDYLESPSITDVTLSCLTPSMFCDKKIVVCTDCQFLSGNSQADVKRKAEAKKTLAEMLRKYDGSYCLVFVCDDDKYFDGLEHTDKVDCNRLDSNSVGKWIMAYGKRQGVAIDKIAADKIASYCLCDMSRVSVETQKLIDSGDVSPETIDGLVHKDAEYAVFDLSKFISQKNAAKALDLYKGLIARGEEPRQLFSLLFSFYRRAYYVKTSGYNADELAAYLGVKAGAVSFAKEVAGKYKPMQLKRALDFFADADERLKRFIDENDVMTLLINQLIAL